MRSVIELLPAPALLIEPGSGCVLFANGPARHARFEVTVGGEGAGDGVALTDSDRRVLPLDEWPHRRAARGERLDGVEISWQTPEGAASFLVSSRPVPAMSGHPALMMVTATEVTRLKATEGELREAVRVRDEFFSFASHELKDPLASLLLSIEVLDRMAGRQESVPAHVIRERLEVSKRQAERLARMIENLLDVSRIAGGRLRMDLEALDLRELVFEVVGRFGELAREAGVALVVEGEGPIIGYFDRVQLDHVIGNLLSNALKYGDGRPITVRIAGGPEVVTLEVEDHGVGIAEADHGRVFERFERASGEHRHRSLGLGLYIVRSIVEAHGGSVGLRSAPGRGSTFVVDLPRMRLPRAEPQPPAPANPAS